MFYGDPEIMARHMATLEEFRSVVEKKYGARVLTVVLPYLHSEELLHQGAFYERFRHSLSEHGLIISISNQLSRLTKPRSCGSTDSTRTRMPLPMT
jgi:hypothetical protein